MEQATLLISAGAWNRTHLNIRINAWTVALQSLDAKRSDRHRHYYACATIAGSRSKPGQYIDIPDFTINTEPRILRFEFALDHTILVRIILHL
jgi:hypothetical protein